MKHRLVYALLLVLMLLAVTPSLAQEPLQITISTWAGVDEAAEFQALLDEMNANNTEFQVTHVPIPADYYTVVKTQLAPLVRERICIGWIRITWRSNLRVCLWV